MLKKSLSKKLVIIIILVISFGCSMGVEPVFTWVEPPRFVAFVDSDQTAGEIGGTLIIIPPSFNIDTVEYFSVYLGTQENEKAEFVIELPQQGYNDIYYEIPKNTPIGDYIQFSVLSRNSEYDAVGTVGCIIEDLQGPPPDYTAQSLSFTDTDSDHREIGGIVNIEIPFNEASITHYVVYLGYGANTVVGGPIGEVEKTGSGLTFEIPDNTPIFDDAYLVIRTRNEFGEMPNGIAFRITDFASSIVGLEVTFEANVQEIYKYDVYKRSNQEEYFEFLNKTPDNIIPIYEKNTNHELFKGIARSLCKISLFRDFSVQNYLGFGVFGVGILENIKYSGDYRDECILLFNINNQSIQSYDNNSLDSSGYNSITVPFFISVESSFNNNFTYSVPIVDDYDHINNYYTFEGEFDIDANEPGEQKGSGRYIFSDTFTFNTWLEQINTAMPYYKVNNITVTKSSDAVFSNISPDYSKCISYVLD